MLSRLVHRRLLLLRASRPPTSLAAHRGLVAPPRPGDGPLMERRPDRDLPDVEATRFRWWRTLPYFIVIVTACSIAIFNYQKLSSPVINSTLYALRHSKKARDYLGDEIYFKDQIPWIGGEMNQLHGRIDITFAVKGTKNTGKMRFASNRPTPKGMFETTEWSLETTDGRKIDLLEGADPFKAIQVGDDIMDLDEDVPATRGFRK